MSARKQIIGLGLFLLVVLASWWVGRAGPGTPPPREQLLQWVKEGHYKDAYDGLRRRLLDPQSNPLEVGPDLRTAVRCLQRLGRTEEVDELCERVLALRGKNPRLLLAVAQVYLEDIPHFGYMIAGQFRRGGHRGGGRRVFCAPRDRARALQLLERARLLCEQQPQLLPPAEQGELYLRYARALLQGTGDHAPWRLQYLTDLSQLPDWEDTTEYYSRWQRPGAPVDEQGNPIFYHLPKSYDAARNDGERWRWLLYRAVVVDSSRRNDAELQLADFLHDQFDVHTLGSNIGLGPEENAGAAVNPFAVWTLSEEETIARLATGVQRFRVPEEFNWIRLYRQIAARGKSPAGEKARDQLARIFENRLQFEQAAAAWKQAQEEYGPGHHNFRRQRLQQIVGNWGRFEPQHRAQPAGTPAHFWFRFRNGTRVTLEARIIRIEQLLEDVKAYLQSRPARLDWQQVNLHNLGYRLIQQKQEVYLGEKVASWTVDLQPRPHHWDRRLRLTTPLTRPGVYLLTARMQDGNTSHQILWLADLAIVEKHLGGEQLYYVADAVSGAPVAGAQVEFLGWQVRPVAPQLNQFRVDTLSFQETTDAQGQVLIRAGRVPEGYQWLVVARKTEARNGTRLAYLGFTGLWFSPPSQEQLDQVKCFLLTDRPIYRPEHTVHYKVWVQHVRYDAPEVSEFAGQQFTVLLQNPKGEVVQKQVLTADAYGGLAGEWTVPRDAPLGQYAVQVRQGVHYLGSGFFRVEEYRKPEFEVQVLAPAEPLRLGETGRATIRARYYFGAPVSDGKVHYQVLRQSRTLSWYPASRWDWLYGAGSDWLAPEHAWYPGWQVWGQRRPRPPWWYRPQLPPEIVAEGEVPLRPDGQIEVPLDTRPAQVFHGNEDHEYTIIAEVTDASRRTIVGTGRVLATRQPFQVAVWLERGFYQVGDTIRVHCQASAFTGGPVTGKGQLTLYRIRYNERQQPLETPVQTWNLDPDAQGQARQQLKASAPGQYRLAYRLTDARQRTVEGGYLFLIRGPGFDSQTFRFNELELITDKKEYQPGENVRLLINSNRPQATVLLFLRPHLAASRPRLVRLDGKSLLQEILVTPQDMPNFYVEALTLFDGQLHTEVCEIRVPPEKRFLRVEVQPQRQEYRPGEEARIQIRLTDLQGRPFVGSAVVTVYDRSLEYLAGGASTPDVKEVFWKWRRYYQPVIGTSLTRWEDNWSPPGETGMLDVGVFGGRLADEEAGRSGADRERQEQEADAAGRAIFAGAHRRAAAAPQAANGLRQQNTLPEQAAPVVPPPALVIRRHFADTAFWAPALLTDGKGEATVTFRWPDNLTSWKVRVWALGQGIKVGQAEAEITTKKDLLVRLHTPRFFTEKDEGVVSANVHNYLPSAQKVAVTLELDGGCLQLLEASQRSLLLEPQRAQRLDWRVRAVRPGEAILRVKAIADKDSDAVEMRFPVFVHGMLKTESYTGVLRPEQEESAKLVLTIPAQRRPEQTRLEVRYSPSLAAALVDALPYLADYPYGCTEQTLNRFLPTVLVQKLLLDLKVDLAEVQKHRTNLNSQELGPDPQRLAEGWRRVTGRNPVFDINEVRLMTHAGIQALAQMQCSDGGWGWFSGFGEQSFPHTTALVVHGLFLAKQNGVVLPPGLLERGLAWLKNYQDEQLRQLQNAPQKIHPFRERADDLDALVYQVLVEVGSASDSMRQYLYRDRTHLSAYAKALFGLALHQQQQNEALAVLLKNLEQYLVQDEENQTAYLRLPQDTPWWCWYGNDLEANAIYLKLLSRVQPKDRRASRLVKYLLNNRRHATYWNSTRDTALCLEALAEYLRASGEDQPDMTIEVWVDGKKYKDVTITPQNLFTFDNSLVLEGTALDSGKHVLEIRRRGKGPVYFNAYLTYFTLEDFLTRAGLEVRVQRKYYKLTRADQTIPVPGVRGQPVGQRTERFVRTLLADLSELRSGDLVEVELEIESKNDYEYIVFEDKKPAGFEPLLARSGYVPNELGAYVELRDDRVCFFCRRLARGQHSVRYRLRAETPGQVSALPTRAYAMYAPELRGNSDEIRLRVKD